MEDFQKYKLKEFKGDALAKFICVLLVAKYYPNEERTFFINKVSYLVSNQKFCEVAKKLSLCIHPEEPFIYDKPFKDFANAFEVKLWEVYEETDIDGAIEFFKQNVMSNKVTSVKESDTSKSK